MEPATRRRRAASTIVGTNTARELKRRCSGGNRFAAGANRGQAPDRAVAYGRALRSEKEGGQHHSRNEHRAGVEAAMLRRQQIRRGSKPGTSPGQSRRVRQGIAGEGVLDRKN